MACEISMSSSRKAESWVLLDPSGKAGRCPSAMFVNKENQVVKPKIKPRNIFKEYIGGSAFVDLVIEVNVMVNNLTQHLSKIHKTLIDSLYKIIDRKLCLMEYRK